MLFDLLPAVSDQTLVITCHPFDAAHNPHLKFENVHWTALLMNINCEPFHCQRFPEGQWINLSEELPSFLEGGVLEIIPVLPGNKETLGGFFYANQASQKITNLIMQHRWNTFQEDILQDLEKIYPFFRNDPFLETCFWDKVFFHSQKDHLDQQSFHDIERALKFGYPAANLFYSQGIYFYRFGFIKKAISSLEAASRLPVNRTPAQQFFGCIEK